jgi:hypothetical protein
MTRRAGMPSRAGRPAVLLGGLILALCVAKAHTVPDEWLRAAPGAAQAAEIERGAAEHGWGPMALALRRAALNSYLRGNYTAADGWRSAARWAAAWAEPAGEHAAGWRAAMSEAGWRVGPGSRLPETPEAPVGLWLDEPVRLRVLGDPVFSEEYFSLESGLDFRPEVYRVLNELYAASPEDFGAYASLAAAISLVYDTSPPSRWPHWQVKLETLPRVLPDARETFRYFVDLDRSGKSLHSLAKLEAAELRFLVDLSLPEAERAWAREKVKTPLARLDATYSDVRYREDRIASNAYIWPGESYTLEEILREGGICVDQAYFATQAGKARGVPTLLFSGAGLDGRHAWFGYLGTGRRWRMDAGRHEGQRYVVGKAIDPLSWTDISDHELAFLSEGFRRGKTAREAAIHAAFARWLLEDGERARAMQAARQAVRLERRTLAAWDLMLEANPEPGREREEVAYEAANGLTSYPELHARYMGVVVGSLYARGETTRAEFLERELARRFKSGRTDLAVKQVAEQMLRARAGQRIDEQVRLYAILMRQFGRGGGAAMWDEVVRPFVEHLVAEGRVREARAALARGREAMGVVPGTQMATEMAKLDEELAKRDSGR